MANIELKYNPYTRETEFSDGARTEDDFLTSHSGQELSSWCAEFITYLIDTYNENVNLTFNGIERDCDTFTDAVSEFNAESKNFSVTFRRKVNRTRSDSSAKNKIEKLRELYTEMRSDTCPFEELRTDNNIEQSFNKALDAEFEIAVVATMSSGKSTLINAMLGNELLPARNEATTATIARIHDDDDADHFHGESFDKDRNEIARCDPLSLENMNQLNDNPDTADIEIYGNIVGISSQSLKLVLTDTPGPNNSRTDEHKNHTYRLIKDSKYKPMVLYILNGTQLETNDDDSLLTDIAEAMRSGGRQASDRFIFVLNKADEFDPEKESVAKKVDDTKKYLESHGIKNPKVFPCSAYVAKLIRQYQAGYPFTRKEKIDLQGNLAMFIDDEELHFSDMAELSDDVRNKLNQEIAAAKKDANEYRETLVYTGIPAVEGAISEYLEKYAQPQKITEALHSFMQIIKDLGTEAKEKSLMKDNLEKVAEKQEAIDKIESTIKKGKKGAELKDKIDALSIEDELNQAFEDVSGRKLGDFISRARNKYCSNKLSEQETKERIKQIQIDLNDLRGKFAIDIENIINEKIGGQAQKFADEYNKYVSELLGSAFGHDVKAASLLGSLASMRLDADNVDEFEFNVKEKTGTETYFDEEERTRTETRTKTRTGSRKKSGFGNSVKRFFGKLFGNDDWGYEDYTYTEEVPVEVTYTVQVQKERDKYENRTYVNFTKMFNSLVVPKIDEFTESARTLATETAQEEEKKLKGAFKKSFDELNKKIEGKLAEQKVTLSDKEKLEQQVEESKRKLAWLTDFTKRLNEALVG